jgi:hypothetical protein
MDRKWKARSVAEGHMNHLTCSQQVAVFVGYLGSLELNYVELLWLLISPILSLYGRRKYKWFDNEFEFTTNSLCYVLCAYLTLMLWMTWLHGGCGGHIAFLVTVCCLWYITCCPTTECSWRLFVSKYVFLYTFKVLTLLTFEGQLAQYFKSSWSVNSDEQ